MAGWWWWVFGVLVIGLLALDLAVFHRRSHREGTREAVAWSVFWVGLGLLFALFVGSVRGHDAALAYLTAFVIEKSLSIDNLFVFIALFAYFGVARESHHKVLFWGILGAIVTRGIFIFAGVALIHRFHFVIYLLGVILVATGAKLALSNDEHVHPGRNLVVRLASRLLPLERQYHGDRFVVSTPSGWRFTPLVIVVLAVESTDVMFAVDSVPAVLAVSQDSFVVYTSNIFAILGLRALYFVVAGALAALKYLRPALALVLVLIGVKMFLVDVVEIPTEVSLGTVGVILVAATVASLVAARRARAGKAFDDESTSG